MNMIQKYFFLLFLLSIEIKAVDQKYHTLSKKEIEKAKILGIKKMNNPHRDISIPDETVNSEDTVQKIVIFAHGTVKFNPKAQFHDELKNFEESRKLFYDISKNNIIDCGKGLDRIQLNQKEHGFRGALPGLVEIEKENLKKEMNQETLESIFLPIYEENKFTKFFLFNWTGGLAHTTRTASAIELLIAINQLRNIYPNAVITYFGHSHGGTIACEATSLCQKIIEHTSEYFNFLRFLKKSFPILDFLIDMKIISEEENKEYLKFQEECADEVDYFTIEMKKLSSDSFSQFNESTTPFLSTIQSLLNQLDSNNKNTLEQKTHIKKLLKETIEKALFYESLLVYTHPIFIDILICVGSPMPPESHKYIAAKNPEGKYLNTTIISLSSPNDTVVDPYIGFPRYTSNKFYQKFRTEGIFNFILTISKGGKIYGLNHHDSWFNERLGKNMKAVIPKYINMLLAIIDQDQLTKLACEYGQNIELEYSVETQSIKITELKNKNIYSYTQKDFFQPTTLFSRVKGVFQVSKSLIWDLLIHRRIETMMPLEYYQGE